MTDAIPLFEARDIHLWRGERHLLRGVSFAVQRGQLLQLVGPNGVGKTSLLRVACGLLPAESGELYWQGKPIAGVSESYCAQMIYLAHGNALKAELTVEENLQLELALRAHVQSSAIHRQLELLDIGHCATLSARMLSAGQKRRVALARVLLAKALLWILDEPTTNLDSSGTALLERCMLEHMQTGGAILAAAHHALLAGHPQAVNLELSA
jgi:heme exporter protein A